MKKTVKEEWIRRLRSGNWKQIKNSLSDGKRDRCCLGVLCDIYAKEQGWKRWWSIEKKHLSLRLGYDSKEEMPSNEVLRWAGIRPNTAENLASMNDSGKSFNEIAKRIEKFVGK